MLRLFVRMSGFYDASAEDVEQTSCVESIAEIRRSWWQSTQLVAEKSQE